MTTPGGRRAVPEEPDHSRSSSPVVRRQSRWATVLAVLQRLLYLAVTIAVGWAVYYFLLARLSRGPEQAWVFLPVWLILAYALLPRIHRILSSLYIPDYFIGRTRTGDGVLGDPVNLAVVGPKEELRQAMLTAGWVEADPITPATAWRTLTSTVLGRSYATAPVSSLYVFGNKQELAFQREIDGNPRKRHHVRFWKCQPGWRLPGGLAVDWVGAGTYDRSVGLSLFTFQITHKIADRTDEERDFIIETLRSANAVESIHIILNYSSGYHHRNGGGDAIRTDGHLPIIDLHPPERLRRAGPPSRQGA
ncbi:LssY-like putative type I secretion system component LssY [Arthrobacter sp. SLBN-100]|uniref:LssY C-terminal domain-containing protein n=1 Tax=Arthrobacter sp. SLBN-100 TaxID=2768450 RepID=UPI00116C12B4|nr:LssY C-terminal domain-containing protein [Arthrobacter sp. SLBN-100]TQJ67618.1 LssY-like putative type I secretion system component LssY [Arthrobacter sp. SLBN-100]